MAVKTPVRGEFDGNGDLTGLSEFQAADFIGIDDGGTGAITASGARTALGLAIGSDIQAFDAQLTDISGLTPTDAHFIVGDGSNFVTETGNTARASLGLATSDSPSFVNLTLTGNLTVQGTQTILQTETLTVDDNIIVLNSNATGSASANAGIEIERGDDTNVTLIWDESNDRWSTGSNNFAAGTFIGNLTGNVTGTVSSLSGLTSDDLAEGSSNFYATNERIDDRVGALLIDSATSGIDIDYDDNNNQLTLSVDLSEITEAFTDKVGGMVTGGTESFINVSYDDSNDRLDFSVATKDEDDMSSNSDTHLPTQQSVKAYVDAQLTASDLDFQADSGGALSIDLDSETITFTGGTGIDTTGSSNDVSFAIDSTVATLTGSQTLTNKTISGADNTLSNIGNSSLSNSTVSFGGVSLALGASDATPAFDLSDATNYPTTSLTGTITNAQLAGSIANAKLANSSIAIGGITFNLGDTDATPAFDLSDATNYPTSSLSGTITNAQLAGSIANAKLANSTITVSDGSNSTATALGGTITFSGTSNEVEVAESSGTVTIGLPNNVTVGNNLTVTGNLTVSGTTTTLNTETLTVEDNIIVLNSNVTGTPSTNAGIEIERGSSTNVTFIYDESADKWTVGSETLVAGTFEGNLTGNVTGNVSGSSGSTTGNAATATALASAQNFSLTGDVTASAVSFDGSGAVALATTIASGAVDFAMIADTIDEDDMSSDSATKLPTQQSVKAYVDSQITAEDLDFQADSGGALAIDLDSETLTFTGGTGIDTSGSGNTVTFAIDSTVVTESSTDTLTNKTVNLENNTVIVEYAVTVQSGNFLIDGEANATISFRPGVVHRFDLSDSSVGSHPFKLSTTSDGSHNSGSEYTTGKTANGSQGSSGAYVEYTVNAATPDILYYYCSSHSGMGGTITVFGSAYGDSDVQSYLSGGTGVTMSGSGEFSIGQAVSTTSNVTFADIAATGNVTITGNLDVNGTTTTIDTTNTTVTDSLIELGNGTSGSPSNDAGIVIERGSADNAFIGFDESADKFIVGTGSFTGASTGNLTISTGTLVANLEGNVTGNVTGNVSGSSGSTTGNAATATQLATGRTIGMTGDVVWTSASFDGSGNVTGTAAIQSGAVETAMLNANVITGQTAETSISDDDLILIYDDSASALRKMTKANFTAGLSGGGGTVTEAFRTIAVSGQTDIVADSATDSLTLAAGSNVTITTNASSDTVTISATDTNTQLTQEQVEDFVNGVIVAGTNITKTYDDDAGTLTIAATGGAANAFSTLAVSGQSNVVADSTTDTLTLVAGTGMTLTTDASADSITFASSGGGGGGTLPFTEFDGSTDDIVLSSAATAGELPVTLAGGSSDPIAMTATTQTLTSYADDDGDTKVEVERTTDNDTVHIKAGGTDVITATSSGVTITNLTVSGTTTQANELKITDTLFELNADGGSLTTDAGMIIERGSTGDNAAFIWDESTDSFVAGTTATDGSAASNLTVTEATLKAATQSQSDNSTKVATTAYVDTAVGNLSSNSISDADNDTKIQVEASSDADEVVITTGGQERAKVDNNISMSARGGFFTHNLTMHASETYTITSTEGTVAAGPLDVQGTVDVQGSLVIL